MYTMLYQEGKDSVNLVDITTLYNKLMLDYDD